MFDAGHRPGAVRMPVEEWDVAAKADDIGCNKTAYWDEALGSLNHLNRLAANAPSVHLCPLQVFGVDRRVRRYNEPGPNPDAVGTERERCGSALSVDDSVRGEHQCG